MKKQNRLEELKNQRRKLCKDYRTYFEKYLETKNFESLCICMDLLNIFDRSIIQDNNLTSEQKNKILMCNEMI